MPCVYYILLVKGHSFYRFFYCLGFQSFVFNNYDFRIHLDFCRFPLILNMNVDRLMVVGIKEKSYSED